MMTDHQSALCSLLLGSFPTFSSGDAEAALAAYELVMRQADERDLQPGFTILLNGEYPGHDGRFAPTAPQLASAIRIARDKRLEHDRIMSAHQARLPAPDVERTPESQARVREITKRVAEVIGAVDAVETADTIAAAKDRWAKVNARFDPPQDEASITKRLLLRAEDRLGYSTGNSDGEEAA